MLYRKVLQTMTSQMKPGWGIYLLSKSRKLSRRGQYALPRCASSATPSALPLALPPWPLLTWFFWAACICFSVKNG